MREIKFRGFYFRKKDVLYPEEKMWVYGSLIIDERGYWIKVGNHSYLVPKESVGQFTGLKDNKRTKEYPEGQDIYEGDILEVDSSYWHDPDGINYHLKGKTRIVYEGKHFDDFPDLGDLREYEVIGNVHENPEMLMED